MTVVFGNPGSGAGQTSLQRAYENSGGVDPMIQLAVADGTLTIRDDATPLADMFALQDNSGDAFLTADALIFDYGERGNRGYEFQLDPTGREGINFLPDGRTQTTTAVQSSCIQWDSLVIADIPGGLPFGNDTAPAMIASIGECRFDDPGNLFSSSLLFNQASILTANGVNVGPVYTMVNQPLVRTGTLGGSRTFSQANAVRSQIRVGPNLAGNVTLTSHVPFFITASVDATVGTASITTMYGIQVNSPNLVAGGTIGTYVGLRLEAISGPSTIRGIESVMNAGRFIDHSGTAPSRWGDDAEIQIGDAGDVAISWDATRMVWQYAAGTSLFWSQAGIGRILLDGNQGATELELNINCESGFSIGAQTGANGNQFGNFVAGAFTQGIAGEVTLFLQTQAANITVNQANTPVRTWTVNAASITLSGPGTVTDNEVLRIQGNPATATVNRVGLRILSNPSGGSGVNAALWCENGDAVFDGRVDINNGVALGGGAAATLGTIGGSGPTAAAQAQWCEIDIGGVPHWIPVWT